MNGCIHIYCGNGKGKTTAALGLSVRAAGSGMRVLFVQFLKGQPTSELESLKLLPNIRVLRTEQSGKFTFQMTPDELADLRVRQTDTLRTAMEAARSGECDLLVLDEIFGALSTQTVDETVLKNFLAHKPAALELVLTGRNPSACYIDQADYVSEIQAVKHPYERGLPARKGIEK